MASGPEEPPPSQPPTARLVTPARIAALSMAGFALAFVAVIQLAWLRVYGPPAGALEVNLYLRYARQILDGMLPYRDFAFEYPPLALLPIVLPALPLTDGINAGPYRTVFQALHAAIGVGIVGVTLRTIVVLGRPRSDLVRAAAFLAVSPLLAGPIIAARYDLWPALLLAVAMWAFASGHDRVAAIAIGLGILAKVYPVVVVPFAVLYLWRRDGGREAAPVILNWLAILGLVVLLGVGPFFGSAPEGILASLTRAFQRALQVETLGASIVLMARALLGIRAPTFHEFESLNIGGPLAGPAAAIQTVVLAGLIGAALVLFARGRPTIDRLVLASVAGLVAFVAVGRVLSPQYMLWLLGPVALVAGGRRSIPLVLLAIAVTLTGLYYPRFYSQYYLEREPFWIGVVIVRNLALVALAVSLLWRLRPTADDERDAAAHADGERESPSMSPAGAT